MESGYGPGQLLYVCPLLVVKHDVSSRFQACGQASTRAVWSHTETRDERQHHEAFRRTIRVLANARRVSRSAATLLQQHVSCFSYFREVVPCGGTMREPHGIRNGGVGISRYRPEWWVLKRRSLSPKSTFLISDASARHAIMFLR